MTAFILIAIAMIALACAVVLVPLWRRPRATLGRTDSNLAIIRDQLAELERDLAAGTLSREQYEQSRADVARRALDEEADVDTPTPPRSRSGKRTAIALAALFPAAAVGLYVLLGTPGALDFDRTAAIAQAQGTAGKHDFSPQQIGEMADRLREKLSREPENAEGWAMLGRTYYVLSRYYEAAAAYEQAVQRNPKDADLLADYADTLGVVQNQSLEGKPLEMVTRALEVNPTQWKALALAGTAAFERKDYSVAIGFWERLRAAVPAGSETAQSVEASIKEARELSGISVAANAPASPALPSGKGPAPRSEAANDSARNAGPGSPAAPAKAAAAATARVSGTVTLAPSVAAQAQPNDVLFIFARATQGPRMPLAILRKQVKDLPVTFTLDDTMSMSPGLSLATVSDVIIGARISKSGNAIAQSGDLEGLSAPTKVGSNSVGIVIDRKIP